ncbi:glycine cleavage system protein P [Aciduliprofundum sp. MAR08-339]|uniref:aminomethyl-transferring glycine dehydrogenase subunit GcvPB n=1 Tax=Aciduliprofundum sp. (strain MAR08-339) TaxID=673860 RepID=UPI0002A4C7C6|nr:glycine cleavage system protein P [Aciduliprofundum sp. MAR08-339]
MYRQARYDEPLLCEMRSEKEREISLDLPESIRREKLRIPNIPEYEMVRHYTRLSQMNYGVDINTYPLGSCTMKYNPRLNEEIARWFAYLHPYQHESTVQGALQIMYELQEMLKKITDMDEFTLQPAAGAHGEFTGMLIVRAYHELRGELEKRRNVLIPDSAHGTNPASAAMAGFNVVEIPSNEEGMVDIEALEAATDDTTAAFMVTNPNTLGIFEENILEIARIMHKNGALLYYDGANLNAIMGITSPGLMGFDIVHLNLHKTFSTPHGGGGPGSGPVGVRGELVDFLPVPIVRYDGSKYYLDYDVKHSIGKVRSFYGNFGVIVKAWAYIKHLGGEGLKNAAIRAVVNSNYLKERIKEHYILPHKSLRKHEFVVRPKNARALDVAKRLLDFGIHAPTIYFPLIVNEALMIEPTETETKDNLDRFADVLIRIARESEENPKVLEDAPHNAAIGRVDDVLANRKPVLTWKMYVEMKDRLDY